MQLLIHLKDSDMDILARTLEHDANAWWYASQAARDHKNLDMAAEYLARSQAAHALLLQLRKGRSQALELSQRADHAERKWHGWHKHTGTFGITCPLCKGPDRAKTPEEQLEI